MTTTKCDLRRALCLAVAITVAATACTSGGEATDAVGVVTGEVCGDRVQATVVVVDEALAITAGHSMAGATGALQVAMADGATAQAEVVAVDPVRDIAALSLDTPLGAPAELGDRVSPLVRLVRLTDGLQLRVIEAEDGRPLNITGEDIYEAPSDVARSGVRATANIEPGFSGGPVLNDGDEVVGMIFAESRSTGFVYALAASEIDAFLQRVETGEISGSGQCR